MALLTVGPKPISQDAAYYYKQECNTERKSNISLRVNINKRTVY